MDLWTLPENTYLSDKEAEAASLGSLSRHLLVRGRTQGWGPVFVKLGSGRNGSVKYRVRDLLAWLKAREATNTAQTTARLPTKPSIPSP